MFSAYNILFFIIELLWLYCPYRDVKNPSNPLRSFEEHTAEVYSVDWNLVEKVGYKKIKFIVMIL